MERLLKYIVGAVFLYSSIVLLYRFFDSGTTITGKLSNIKIEPYYPEHKDSSHYVVTFAIMNYKDRLAVYIGNKDRVKSSTVVQQLDIAKSYTINFDQGTPTYDGMNIGVRKIVVDGRTIYKDRRFLMLIGGIVGLSIGLFLLIKK